MSSPSFRGKMVSRSGKTESQNKSPRVSPSLRACSSPNNGGGLVDTPSADNCARILKVVDTVKQAETSGGGRTMSVFGDGDKDVKSSLSTSFYKDGTRGMSLAAIELDPVSICNEQSKNSRLSGGDIGVGGGDSNKDGKGDSENRSTQGVTTGISSSVKSDQRNDESTTTPGCPNNRDSKKRGCFKFFKRKVGHQGDERHSHRKTASVRINVKSEDSLSVNLSVMNHPSPNNDKIVVESCVDAKNSDVVLLRVNDIGGQGDTQPTESGREDKMKKDVGRDKPKKKKHKSIHDIQSVVVLSHLNFIPEGKRYEDYFTVEPKDDEEFGKKPRWFIPRCKYYLEEMGCGTSNPVVSMEGRLPIVVFGATGVVGGAVVRALLKDPRFSVRAVTRTPTTDQARALADLGAVVVPADLNDVRSLQRVMDGAAGVFLTTNFWEHLSKQKELNHGMNAVDAAVSCNVHHFIFQGSDHTRENEKPCGHMNAKAAIEEYVKETALPYTAMHVPFLYENLVSLFKPHCVNSGLYTLPIPLGDGTMDCMALHDLARCVVNIFLRPKNHMMKSVDLTGDRMTVQHMVEVLNRHFDDRKFVYHTMTPDDFASFDFQGCQDLAAMFEYMQTAPHRDPRITRRIHHSVICFDKWVADNKQKLADAMKDTGEES